ncbi:unnamed protein product [Clavelina lepadiformis]|uniref:Uncharacterized protein n=1 Tax=Clavelina lepadiformis TaxID=159417 RepID=A0ABP0FMI9_CLALP
MLPSFVETNILVNAGFTEKESVEMFADESRKHPLNERNIKVEEVVDAILFLASDKATMITGSCLKFDGGRELVGQ